MQIPKVKLSLIAISVSVALGLVACAGNKTVAQNIAPKTQDTISASTPLVANETETMLSGTAHISAIPAPDKPAGLAEESPGQTKFGPPSYSKPEQNVLFFSFNQSSLADTEIALLKSHAEYLVANPELNIDIHGHTDSHGSKVYNNYLSRKRAEKVAAVLIANGVDTQQIRTQGFADDQPYDMANSARQQRRVELVYPDSALATLQ